jgi:hypothetical protein
LRVGLRERTGSGKSSQGGTDQERTNLGHSFTSLKLLSGLGRQAHRRCWRCVSSGLLRPAVEVTEGHADSRFFYRPALCE